MEGTDFLVVLVPREELKDMEHLYFDGEVVPCCPRCYRPKGEPHRFGCWIAEALGSAQDVVELVEVEG